MAGGVQRLPSRADDVAGMNDGGRKALPARHVDQVRFDPRLVDSILAERTARLHLRGRNFDARTVHPDRAAMQEMPHPPAERLDEMARARLGEADHVDDDVGLELCDLRAERAGLLLVLAEKRDGAHGFPGAMRRIGRTRAAADGNHLEAGSDEARDEISADVAGSSDDHDARHGAFSERGTMRGLSHDTALFCTLRIEGAKLGGRSCIHRPYPSSRCVIARISASAQGRK